MTCPAILLSALLGNSAKPPPDHNALAILVVVLGIALLLAGIAVLLSKVGRS